MCAFGGISEPGSDGRQAQRGSSSYATLVIYKSSSRSPIPSFLFIPLHLLTLMSKRRLLRSLTTATAARSFVYSRRAAVSISISMQGCSCSDLARYLWVPGGFSDVRRKVKSGSKSSVGTGICFWGDSRLSSPNFLCIRLTKTCFSVQAQSGLNGPEEPEAKFTDLLCEEGLLHKPLPPLPPVQAVC